MYYQHFRLKGPPFQAASPDGAVYFSPTHLEGLATLESGLAHDLTGFTLLTGEAGTGKTTLIYSLLQRDYKRARIAHIDDPKLSFLEIMQVILRQLNLYSTGATKLDYLEALDRFLQLRGKDERIAIVIDEAQVLSDDVLEELRLLSNHVQSNDRNLQLILVGHPELAERLKKPDLRQLNQRISSRGVLKPLNAAQSIKYVECKLSAQDGKISTVFERGALKCLLARSDGLPRKINMLCHNAMLTAYNGLEKKVSYKTARKIANEYHDSVRITKQGLGAHLPALVAGAAFASLLLLGLVYPKVWSVLSANIRFGRTVAPVRQARVANRPEPIDQAKAVEQAKPAEQSGAEVHPDAGAKLEAAAPAVARPIELGASAPAAAVAPAAPKVDAAAPPIAPDTRTAPSAPALAAAPALAVAPPVAAAPAVTTARAVTQKPSAVIGGVVPRSRITVRSGDTLEKIAIDYFGSKSGINQLIDANPQLTDINQLTVGQVLYLPAGVAPKAPRDQAADAPPASDARDSSEP
jgi:type II secretory pathway predicted ATPase ExeA/LysM repeat protein